MTFNNIWLYEAIFDARTMAVVTGETLPADPQKDEDRKTVGDRIVSAAPFGNRSRHSTRSCPRIATAAPGFHGGVAAVLPIMV